MVLQPAMHFDKLFNDSLKGRKKVEWDNLEELEDFTSKVRQSFAKFVIGFHFSEPLLVCVSSILCLFVRVCLCAGARRLLCRVPRSAEPG